MMDNCHPEFNPNDYDEIIVQDRHEQAVAPKR